MSSRFLNEWVTDLNDEVLGGWSSCQNTLNKLPLACRYPELDLGQSPSNFTDSLKVFDALYVTTVMPPKIRTLSTVMSNDDHHCSSPVGVSNSSQPFLQGLTDIWACIIASVCITLFTDTALNLSKF